MTGRTGEEAGTRPTEVALVPVPDRPRGILALDIDGTLLGPDGQLGERTRRAVHAAGEAGWLVTLATGRRWGSTKPIADAVGLRVPLICFNGALVRDSVSAEILHYNPLPVGAVEPLVGALVARGLQPVLYEDFQTGERLLTGPVEFDSEPLARWLVNLRFEHSPEVARLSHAELARIPSAVRLVVYDAPERIRGVEALAGELGLDYRTLYYPAERRGALMAELLHLDGTKAVAIAALAARYGLTLGETIAVGDGHNDLEMLAEAAIGVAMGQASPEVRAHATLTIGDHLDEGLADFIERELLHGTGFPRHLVGDRR